MSEMERTDAGMMAEMDGNTFAQLLKENLGDEGINISDLERIQHDNGSGFIIPDPLEGDQDVKEFEAVIITHRKNRAYFPNAYTGENESPDCYSKDGITGVGEPGGECAQCPMAQWGSDGDGAGQACKETKTLYLKLNDSDFLPKTLKIPTASLKGAKKFFLALTFKGIPLYGVRTKFEIEKTKNKNGIKHDVIKMSIAGYLSPEEIQANKAMKEAFERMI